MEESMIKSKKRIKYEYIKDPHHSETYTTYAKNGEKSVEHIYSSYQTYTKYDNKGEIIYYNDSSGKETLYDENHNIIYEHDWYCGKWKDYDSNNRLIHQRQSDGLEWWIEYDEKGRKSHYIDNNNREQWWEYGQINNISYIHQYNNYDDYEEWYKYNKYGDLIHHQISGCQKYIDGVNNFWQYDYNNKNQLIHCKTNADGGYEYWKEYDEDGDLIHYHDSKGNIKSYQYYNDKTKEEDI